MPDSFLASQSYIFHVTSLNYDKITTFNDIWTHILNPRHLELLTDFENGNSKLKSLETTANFEPSNDRYIQVFEQSHSDPD